MFPEVQLVYLREDADFTCNSVGTKKWEKDGKPINAKYITPQSTLHFSRVKGGERGIYICKVFDKQSKSFVTRGYGELIIGGIYSILLHNI